MKKIILTLSTALSILVADISIKATINKDISSTYFAVVDIEFTNDTEQWIEINNPSISFGKNNKYIDIIGSNKLNAWVEGLKNKKDDSSVMDFIKDTSLMFITGGLSGLFSIGADISSNTVASNSIKKSKLYPKGHILNQTKFLVPPYMKIKRYMVVNSHSHKLSGYINIFTLKYNKTNSKDIVFRDKQYNLKVITTPSASSYMGLLDDEFDSTEVEKPTERIEKIKNEYIWQSDI